VVRRFCAKPFSDNTFEEKKTGPGERLTIDQTNRK
jgi:hypothetical protein